MPYDGLTPQQVASRRRMSQALLSQGTSTAPVQHWTQALARVVQGGLGGYQQGSADQGEAEGRRDANMRLTRALTNRASPTDTATSLMGNPWSEETGEKLAVSQLTDDPTKEYRTRASAAEQSGLARGSPEWKTFVLTGKLPDELDEARLGLVKAQTAAVQSKATATQSADETRTQELERLGIDPLSAEGRAYRLNGKLPQAAYQQMNQIQLRERAAPKITSGLENLNKMTETYDDPSFQNAVGPFQGSTPTSLIGAVPINAARLFGEVSNFVEMGNTNPSEVRSNIQGATEALAAAIKPLIRGPGEGVWTDADQERLVAVVGDLAQSRNKDEFKRRLNAVRDRVKSNFALDIDFDAERAAKVQGSLAAPPSAADVPQIQSNADFDALPSGAQFIGPDGKLRQKP